MDEKVTSSIGIYLNGPKVTLGDIYKWLEKVQAFNIPMDHQIDDAVLGIYIQIPIDTLNTIECADHFADDIQHDVIIDIHTCKHNNKEKS